MSDSSTGENSPASKAILFFIRVVVYSALVTVSLRHVGGIMHAYDPVFILAVFVGVLIGESIIPARS